MFHIFAIEPSEKSGTRYKGKMVRNDGGDFIWTPLSAGAEWKRFKPVISEESVISRAHMKF